MTGVLDVRGVTHGRRDRGRPVLEAVHLAVDAGQVVALVGRSGKSTLCQLVAGLERPDRGEVLVAGVPAHEVAGWSDVAYQPQRLGLADELTVQENALLPCWLAGRQPTPDLFEALGLTQISTRVAGQTSLGEQQRTGVARALAVRPRLAVLDEPTGHQDDGHVGLVLAALRLAASQGGAVLVATHDARVISVADRAVHLDGGRVRVEPQV